MTKNQVYDEIEDLDGEVFIPRIKNMPDRDRARSQFRPRAKKKEKEKAAHEEIQEQVDDTGAFQFTYQAARHEGAWLLDSLGNFYDERWISDVLQLVKGGKEANVYRCEAHHTTGLGSIAAKVYRPRMYRNLKNDHQYREGRNHLDENGNVVVDSGQLHAIHKGTEYGYQLLRTSWIEYEFTTLQNLHAAGADVPAPYASGNNAILMEYIGDESGAAPTLNSIRLDRDEARPLFERVLHNIQLMLANHRVHGDLSAYNILYWDGEITLIDFPQVIDPHNNRNAFRIFERDIFRICEYFARQGVPSTPRQLAADLWTSYHYRLAPEVHPRLLDEENPADRTYWQGQAGGG